MKIEFNTNEGMDDVVYPHIIVGKMNKTLAIRFDNDYGVILNTNFFLWNGAALGEKDMDDGRWEVLTGTVTLSNEGC